MSPKVLALARARFLCHFPYRERIQGVLDGVHKGSCGTPGAPPELAALAVVLVELLRAPGPRREGRAVRPQLPPHRRIKIEQSDLSLAELRMYGDYMALLKVSEPYLAPRRRREPGLFRHRDELRRGKRQASPEDASCL